MDLLQDIAAIFSSTDVQLALAGGFGGLLRAVFLKVKAWDGPLAVVVGAVLGVYASPIFTPWVEDRLEGFKVDPARIPPFTALVVGVVGIAIVGFFIDAGQNWIRKLKGGDSVDPSPKNGGS